MTEREYEVGQEVAVPWGLDVIEGTVVGSYGSGPGRRILVDVSPAGDTSEAETLAFPVHVLESAEVSKLEKEPGSWLSAYRYEAELGEALQRVLSRFGGEWSSDRSIRQGPDSGYDFAFFIKGRLIVVEAKHYSRPNVPVRTEMAAQLARHISQLRNARNAKIVGLLITSGVVPAQLESNIEQFRREGSPMWATHWRPEDGDAPLVEVVSRALSNPA
ncbi:hypothetical protein N8I84_26940 [Streptomyces cynarae]|uniref:Restriction endonuclease type IV Mrr domain-containing protein n=1 Tax=Streptomyces cynarae TaxID=2981134 RepID=A0ABY6E6S5_9ACTN|nr:hypothetical protein [Streptomyces cynarae]UXY21932.1 hypothetical protein N8I84_26940 [Streptomyces cynarae]